MAWLILLVAGLFEIAWAVGLKLTDGFRRPGMSAATVAGMALSFVLLAAAMRSIPMGTAYAVWTGIGTAGTAILGIAYFGESADWPRLACVTMILAGIVGLKLVSPR